MSSVKPGRSAVLTPGAHAGRTMSGRAVGSCGECGAGIATAGADAATVGKCPGCGARVRLHMVYGEHSDIPCDSRCMGAVGPLCSCACGGANHGAWFMNIELVPVWDRDKARAAQDKRTGAHAARREAKRQAADARRAAMIEAHPELVDVMGERYADSDFGFVSDMRDALAAGRELTDRQIAALVKMVKRDREREARQAARDQADAAARAAGVRVPSGRVTVSGVIVSAKQDVNYQFNYHGKVEIKITVVTGEGWRAYGILPRAAYPSRYNGASFAAWRDSLTGRAIQFDAEIQPSQKDQLFGFFKRPTRATLGPVPADKPAPMCERCGDGPHLDGGVCGMPGAADRTDVDTSAVVDQAGTDPGARVVHVPDTGAWFGPMSRGQAHALAASWEQAGHPATVRPADAETLPAVAAHDAARDQVDADRFGTAPADVDPATAGSVDQVDAPAPFVSAWSATLAAPASVPVSADPAPAPTDPGPAPFVSAWSL